MVQINVGIHFLVVWCFYRSRFCICHYMFVAGFVFSWYVCSWFCRMFIFDPWLISMSPLNSSVHLLW
jgi:hypothetical protein